MQAVATGDTEDVDEVEEDAVVMVSPGGDGAGDDVGDRGLEVVVWEIESQQRACFATEINLPLEHPEQLCLSLFH
jgi:hypothetical protein